MIPLFEDTPVLKALATGKLRDKNLTSISLANGFDLQLGWSGSASSLASDPIRFVYLDEVDKFEEFAGKEAAPVDLARTRMRTYEDRAFLVALSTPTVVAAGAGGGGRAALSGGRRVRAAAAGRRPLTAPWANPDANAQLPRNAPSAAPALAGAATSADAPARRPRTRRTSHTAGQASAATQANGKGTTSAVYCLFPAGIPASPWTSLRPSTPTPGRRS